MTNREKIVACAIQQIGIKEEPAGSNKVKYNDWFYPEGHPYYKDSKPYAWCGTAVSFIYNYADWGLPKIDSDLGVSYVPTMYHRAKQNNWITTTPKPADIVIFDFNLDGKWDHIGIFEKWIEEGKTFYCLEGNTTPDGKTGSQSNGGEFCRKKRTVNKGALFINVIDKQ